MSAWHHIAQIDIHDLSCVDRKPVLFKAPLSDRDRLSDVVRMIRTYLRDSSSSGDRISAVVALWCGDWQLTLPGAVSDALDDECRRLQREISDMTLGVCMPMVTSKTETLQLRADIVVCDEKAVGRTRTRDIVVQYFARHEAQVIRLLLRRTKHVSLRLNPSQDSEPEEIDKDCVDFVARCVVAQLALRVAAGDWRIRRRPAKRSDSKAESFDSSLKHKQPKASFANQDEAKAKVLLEERKQAKQHEISLVRCAMRDCIEEVLRRGCNDLGLPFADEFAHDDVDAAQLIESGVLCKKDVSCRSLANAISDVILEISVHEPGEKIDESRSLIARRVAGLWRRFLLLEPSALPSEGVSMLCGLFPLLARSRSTASVSHNAEMLQRLMHAMHTWRSEASPDDHFTFSQVARVLWLAVPRSEARQLSDLEHMSFVRRRGGLHAVLRAIGFCPTDGSKDSMWRLMTLEELGSYTSNHAGQTLPLLRSAERYVNRQMQLAREHALSRARALLDLVPVTPAPNLPKRSRKRSRRRSRRTPVDID
ncbi:MAG: hypothetical protein MHM6MM_000245 [Cercozoa sp. M6MM]